MSRRVADAPWVSWLTMVILAGLSWVGECHGQSVPAISPNLDLFAAGTVNAIVVQADGKIIVGGTFEEINGVPRHDLARLNADGSLDETWDPNAGFYSSGFAGFYSIDSLAIDGNTLYVGGNFSGIGGVSATCLARINLSDAGTVDGSWLPNPNGPVEAMMLNGQALYIGGHFRKVGSIKRNYLARVFTNGGVDPVWNPSPNGFVSTIAPDLVDVGDVFVAGSFKIIGGRQRIGVAKLSPAGAGSADGLWNPSAAGSSESAIAVSGSAIFLVDPNFKVVEKVSQAGTGSPLSYPNWAPGLSAEFTPSGALSVSGSNLYVAGLVTGTTGAQFGTVACLDVQSGASRWAQETFNGGSPGVFLSQAQSLLAGGSFFSLQGSAHLGIAELDPATGLEIGSLATEVELPGSVSAIGRQADGHVVIGGAFSLADGLLRQNLLRLNVDGSIDQAWAPGSSLGVPSALVCDGNDIYVSGLFLVGYQSVVVTGSGLGPTASLQVNISPAAAVSAGAGWRLRGESSYNASGAVLSPLVPGTYEIQFSTVAGYTAPAEQEISLTAGDQIDVFVTYGSLPAETMTSTPAIEGTTPGGGSNKQGSGLTKFVSGGIIPAGGGIIVLGGGITEIGGGFARRPVVKFDPGYGDVPDPEWIPSISGNVETIASGTDSVVIGGNFVTVNSQTRNGLAKLTKTGAILDSTWNPPSLLALENPLSYPTGTVQVSGDYVYVGAAEKIGKKAAERLLRIPYTGNGSVDSSWRPPVLGNGEPYVVSGTDVYYPLGKSLSRSSITGDGSPDPSWGVSVAHGTADVTCSALAASGTEVYAAEGSSDIVIRRILTSGAGSIDPNFSEEIDPAQINALLADGPRVYVIGDFTVTNNLEPQSGLALFATAEAPVIASDPDNPSTVFIGPNPDNGPEVTYFQVTQITGGTLYLPDGVTVVNPGDFVSVADGDAGLEFLASGIGTPGFTAAAALTDSAAGTGSASTAFTFNGTALPIFQLSQPTYSVDDDAGMINVTVLKTGSAAGSVNYQLVNGSAQYGVNYTAGAQSGTLDFSGTESSMTIPIQIIESGSYTGDLTFTVKLTPAIAAAPAESGFSPQEADQEGVVIDGVATVDIVDISAPTGTGSVTEFAGPVSPPDPESSLEFTFSPSTANGEWQILGDPFWYSSGQTVTGLTSGNYPIEFLPVAGYDSPTDQPQFPVLTGSNSYPAIYTAIGMSSTGDLTITIQPAAVASGTDPSEPGQWQIDGQTYVNGQGQTVPLWHNSGEVVTGLNAGAYNIEFSAVSGFTVPPPLTVNVIGGQLNSASGTYLIANASGGALPATLPFSQVQTAPYEFNGQIATSFGYGSGVAVQDRVVLTAAHVLFDDNTLSYATQVEWFPQQSEPDYLPPPQSPAGWYIFENYATQRETDISEGISPGVSTPASQNLDVAAMYFTQLADNGGSAGYLMSDANNQYLLSGTSMMLVGYPVTGMPGSELGTMCATSPSVPVTFTSLYGQVYATTSIQGYPGMSGGPLFVQYSDGNYYPAGIFLGGNAETLVRAIDTEVSDLINRAEAAGNGGANYNSGGVGDNSPGNTGPPSQPTQLSVIIEPVEAALAGAKWQCAGETVFHASGDTVTYTPAQYNLAFESPKGYVAPDDVSPTPVTATVIENQVTTKTVTFLPAVEITGSASPALDGNKVTGGQFAIGYPAEAIATPGPDYSFVSWTDTNGNVLSIAAHYEFTAESDEALTGNFKIGPLAAYKGNYFGLITGTNGEGAGLFRLTLSSASGVFTGTFIYQGKSHAIHGQLGSDGSFPETLVPGTTLGLSLQLDVTNGTRQMTGNLQDGSDAEGIAAGYAPFTSGTSWAGAYTFLLQPPAPNGPPNTLPQGCGYGTMTIDKKGGVSVMGATLGDGTRVSFSSEITAAGMWPLFITPYKHGGSVSGWVTMQAQPGVSDFGATLNWTKSPSPRDRLYPGGFQTETTMVGSRYAVPTNGHGELSFSGTSTLTFNLATPLSEAVSIGSNNKLAGPAPDDIKLTIDAKTGTFSGSFLDPGADTIRGFEGAVLQTGQYGGGLFESGTQTMSMELQP